MRSRFDVTTLGGPRKFWGETELGRDELKQLPKGKVTYQEMADAAVDGVKARCDVACGKCAIDAVMHPTSDGQMIDIGCSAEMCKPQNSNPLVIDAQNALVESLVGEFGFNHQPSNDLPDQWAADPKENESTDYYYQVNPREKKY